MSKVTFDKTTDTVINPAIQEFNDWYTAEHPAEYDGCTRGDVYAYKHRESYLRCWLSSRDINLHEISEQQLDPHYMSGV